jgi:hypothetical protein
MFKENICKKRKNNCDDEFNLLLIKIKKKWKDLLNIANFKH